MLLFPILNQSKILWIAKANCLAAKCSSGRVQRQPVWQLTVITSRLLCQILSHRNRPKSAHSRVKNWLKIKLATVTARERERERERATVTLSQSDLEREGESKAVNAQAKRAQRKQCKWNAGQVEEEEVEREEQGEVVVKRKVALAGNRCLHGVVYNYAGNWRFQPRSVEDGQSCETVECAAVWKLPTATKLDHKYIHIYNKQAKAATRISTITTTTRATTIKRATRTATTRQQSQQSETKNSPPARNR